MFTKTEHGISAGTVALSLPSLGVAMLHSAAERPSLLNPQATDEGFRFTARFPPGWDVVVEFCDSLSEPDWKLLVDIDETTAGPLADITDDRPRNAERYYRVANRRHAAVSQPERSAFCNQIRIFIQMP